MRASALIALLCLSGIAASQDVIDISVKGISDNNRDGAQKDRMEAILDAKRQACEKAGMSVNSKTTVENFKVVFDYVESQAAAVLLPGFQVIDVGYMEDSTYSIVLVGKLKKGAPDPKERADFTILFWLTDKGKTVSERTAVLDKFYAWLDVLHGRFIIGTQELDKFEEHLAGVMLYDSLYYSGRRFYALTYNLPVGDLVYEQRTPTASGGVSKHDYTIKLRAGKQYLINVAHCNAVYFDRPGAIEGKFVHPREKFVYPEDFEKITLK
ncbi:MAG: hypothetical protein GF398_02880 [Chitinivibrionales bacterium]|nr:hypothetical protein [Chitinivibrionales bacterium]